MECCMQFMMVSCEEVERTRKRVLKVTGWFMVCWGLAALVPFRFRTY